MHKTCHSSAKAIARLGLRDTYEEKLRLGAAKKFGKSSDKVPDSQISFFNEAEVEQRPTLEEPKIEKSINSKKASQKRGVNKDSFNGIPVEIKTYDISDEEKLCANCSGEMHQMSEEIRREIKLIPAKLVVEEHRKAIYSCRHCEKTSDDGKASIVMAKAPNPVLPGSFCSPSLLAYLMYQKYYCASPLNRQEKILDDFGIEISKQTMSNWIIKGTNLYLESIYDAMKRLLAKETFIQADETTMRVLTKDGEPTKSTAYMWLYKSGRYGLPIAIYEYQHSRAGKHPQNFLKDFSGYLQTDGYAGYNSVENVERVGCLAHARRYFIDTLKAAGNIPITETHTHQAIKYIKDMFELEDKWKEENLTADKRFEARNSQLKPLFEAYFT